jgi:hypothetical protein
MAFSQYRIYLKSGHEREQTLVQEVAHFRPAFLGRTCRHTPELSFGHAELKHLHKACPKSSIKNKSNLQFRPEFDVNVSTVIHEHLQLGSPLSPQH